MYVTTLVCSSCATHYEPGRLYNLCQQCGKPLLVHYDLERVAGTLKWGALATRPATLWRYREVLPVVHEEHITTLGEGWTPLLHAHRLGERLGMRHLYIKDEALNPTASFKARGMAVAVSMAKELGVRKLAVPSAGNAGGALAAYAARAGLDAYVVMPRDVPRANLLECQRHGAHVTLVEGVITECGRVVAERKGRAGWFEVSTLKEPYRLEGKKTMGYELVEQLHGEVPDVIIYPTGGGTGLIGMWKAFDELERLGWIGLRRPRMVTVQAAGCAPIVQAFAENAAFGAAIANPHTVAAGLRVPSAIGDFLILDILRRSGGTAVSVSDAEMMEAVADLGATTGIFAAPEGAACVPALHKLLAAGQIRKEERVVLFNTGSGLKYLDLYQTGGTRGSARRARASTRRSRN